MIHLVLFIAPLVLMFIGMRQFAFYMGGTYVADKAITVGMAVQMANCADHLQHSARAIMDMLPEFLKVTGPIGRVCDMINSKPTIEPYPGMPPKLKIPIVGTIEFKDVRALRTLGQPVAVSARASSTVLATPWRQHEHID